MSKESKKYVIPLEFCGFFKVDKPDGEHPFLTELLEDATRFLSYDEAQKTAKQYIDNETCPPYAYTIMDEDEAATLFLPDLETFRKKWTPQSYYEHLKKSYHEIADYIQEQNQSTGKSFCIRLNLPEPVGEYADNLNAYVDCLSADYGIYLIINGKDLFGFSLSELLIDYRYRFIVDHRITEYLPEIESRPFIFIRNINEMKDIISRLYALPSVN